MGQTPFEASVSLSWDLSDLAYPPEAPESSREARQRMSLRDNILDEVNQLYFDRRRTLVARESSAAFALAQLTFMSRQRRGKSE